MTMKVPGILLAAALLAACGDPFRVAANREVVEDTLAVYALTGTDLALPTGINSVEHRGVRVESGSGFDLAFDITASGQPVLLPPAAIGGVGRAGIQSSAQEFDELVLAPQGGYNDSTATAIAAGDVVVVRAEPQYCAQALNPFIFSKYRVDSVDVANRILYVRMRVDPNCGYRSLADGVPTG